MQWLTGLYQYGHKRSDTLLTNSSFLVGQHSNSYIFYDRKTCPGTPTVLCTLVHWLPSLKTDVSTFGIFVEQQ